MRLSVAIITYNEESQIADCLNSVVNLADEIVVLDSFSDDDTRNICVAYEKVNFAQHVFDGHIEQKNRALSLCQGDWILCIDADERVSPELAQEISHFLENPGDIGGVKFPRLSRHSGKYMRHGGWYPNARCRLVRKGKAVWGGQNPHDVLVVDGPQIRLHGDLLHFTCTDLADQVETINQFSSVAALSRWRKGKKFRLWRLLLLPVWKMTEIYIIKRGFLDGMRGFTSAVSSSYSTFLKEAKLYELDRLKLDKPSNLGQRYEEGNS